MALLGQSKYPAFAKGLVQYMYDTQALTPFGIQVILSTVHDIHIPANILRLWIHHKQHKERVY
jgi:hypothetical protein